MIVTRSISNGTGDTAVVFSAPVVRPDRPTKLSRGERFAVAPPHRPNPPGFSADRNWLKV